MYIALPEVRQVVVQSFCTGESYDERGTLAAAWDLEGVPKFHSNPYCGERGQSYGTNLSKATEAEILELVKELIEQREVKD